jgi:hypothetical protein
LDTPSAELGAFLARVSRQEVNEFSFRLQDLNSINTFCQVTGWDLPQALSNCLQEERLLSEKRAAVWPIFLIFAVVSGGILGAFMQILCPNISSVELLWATRGYWLAGLWAAFSLCLAIVITFARDDGGWGWLVFFVLMLFFSSIGIIVFFSGSSVVGSAIFSAAIILGFGLALFGIFR